MTTTESRPAPRWLRPVLWLAILLALGGLAAAAFWPGDEKVAGYADAFGGAFELVDQNGRIVTDRSLRGKPFAIFFGFTRCPDICPTTLQRMSRLKRQLGPAGEKLRLVFVSLDPERDSPKLIGDYVSLFPESITGLTGSPVQLARIIEAYHVYREKVPIEGGDYLIDHTATTFLMDAEGHFFGALAHGEADDTSLAKLRRLVGA
ncbi:SCO family protein [Rhizorhabdus sp. FW153]|uniref:SCO family protein n=1 Tax=Rhizorhabdus sp. FW153 TaxID=3400216 RepID=UPI003CF88751